jgi:hypothetical protein
MFMHLNYNPASTNCSPTVEIHRDPLTADSTIPMSHIEATDNNVATYQITIRNEVTVSVALPPPEPKEKKPNPIRNPVFQPPVREIVAPWQAKWRLTQQRPRDGLR